MHIGNSEADSNTVIGCEILELFQLVAVDGGANRRELIGYTF